MNLFFLITKIVVVIVFLVMFLRGSKLTWGIGLLTVTSAILLDAFLGTFDRQEMIAQFGFFFYVLAGALFAGAAIWLWGVLRPWIQANPAQSAANAPVSRPVEPGGDWTSWMEQEPVASDTAYDRQMLYEQIRYRFSPDDVRDLIFDLGLNENDVVGYHQSLNELIVSVMDAAESKGQTGSLALAVERILTPVPATRLPRLEKLTSGSPPTVLRHFLLAHYNVADIARLAEGLGLDWELIDGPGKKAKARNLLLFLYRRNRIGELVQAMQSASAHDEEA